MRYSICIIDDDIPASEMEGIRETELLNGSTLKLLLLQQEALWTDEVIKNLVETLLEQKEAAPANADFKWDVYGFTDPSFLMRLLDGGLSRFDIIIFDWDYATGADSEEILRQILEKTFCLVFVFSGADKEVEIKAILTKPQFHEYKERLEYLNKSVGGTDQSITLLQKAEEMYANNFSFNFASALRKKALQGIDKILSDMGKASLNDVKNHVVVGDGGKKDFVDFLAERFRTAVAGKEIYELIDKIPKPVAGAPALDESVAPKVWSCRLYFNRETGDDLVRRGDIVKITDKFYMVLSADCDLVRFWKKNLGIINMVVLHELDSANSNLKTLLTQCVKSENISVNAPSGLLGQIGQLASGPFILPFVPTENAMKNFIVLPKDIFSQRIDLPSQFNPLSEKEKSQKPVQYSHWLGTKRICTISEPFLTPVIQHVLNIIGGHGVPDYPDHMKDILKKILVDFSAVAVATAAPAPASTPKTV